MPVIDILEIGKQGLTTHRDALQTTSNNIANVNTPGYSRQRVMLSTIDQGGGQGKMPGVEIQKVIRVHDAFARSQILEEAKNFSSTKARSEGIQRVERLMHNDGHRIGDLLNNFFNDFRELSANPEMNTLQTNVTFSAEAACNGFKAISENMKNMQKEMDTQIESSVKEVNMLAKEIAELNSRIAQSRIKGEPPADLLDRRDSALRSLSDKIGYQMSYDGHEHVNIVAGGVGVLVNGSDATELVVQRTPGREGKAPGALDIFIKEGKNLRLVTDQMNKGSIGGTLHVRDKVINPTLKQLDVTAFSFGKAVNELHKSGVGRDGIGNRNLFTEQKEISGASANLALSDEIKKSSESIAVGMTPGARGDNRVALGIADLQTAQVLGDGFGKITDVKDITLQGSQTLNDALNGMVGSIGAQAFQEEQVYKHQEAIIGQLENYEKSISGVNLDEEAINLVQYQSAFNASAKAMKVADDLLQTILSLK